MDRSLQQAIDPQKKLTHEKDMGYDELFKIGVEWATEIFVFYGILTAVAIWEINKFNRRSLYTLQKVDQLELL